ncbi:MAG: hypothetical protein KIT34_06015 [Cyanobacteria bacterium TGS_CYA1]|nr:hypothetical protein [Cyanobacteria bacterium TGS_CYA1]MDX2108128.1 hypothetical protein [Candidatus Melainabacteria bacterium]
MANIQPNSNVPHPERNFGVSSKRRADDFQAMPWATQHVSFSKVGLTGVALNRLLELVNKFSTTFSHQERDRIVLQKALETVLDRRKSVRDLALMLFGGDDEMSYQVHFAFEQALRSAGILAITETEKVEPGSFSMSFIVKGTGIRITNFDKTTSGALRTRFDEIKEGIVQDEILMGDTAFAPIKAALRKFLNPDSNKLML